MAPVPPDPLGRWLTAVALGGQGRYAAAWAVLARLLAEPAVPAPVAAHAAVTRASHLRQMGGHAAARRLDALGLRIAGSAPGDPVDPDGTGLAAARLDATVGLAADALGCGDTAAAHRLLAAVREPVQGHPSWRLRVRWGWVGAELALVEGRVAAAVAPAAAAHDEATVGGSRRHIVKSRIVLIVARAAAGDIDSATAITELAALERECADRGLLPLCRPAALAAADLLDRNDTRAGSAGGTPGDRSSDAARRRHAARITFDVLCSRSDPEGRRRMGCRCRRGSEAR